MRLHLRMVFWAIGASALVAIALALLGLQKMSWIAGGGSFVVAVSALALTWMVRPFPSGVAAANESGADQDRVVLQVTTAARRIGARVGGGVSGLLAAGVLSPIVTVAANFVLSRTPFDFLVSQLDLAWVLRVLITALLMAALCSLLMASDGDDTLVVDATGMTVVDRRWLRLRDRSRLVRWNELLTIRVRPDYFDEAYQAVVVRFADVGRANALQACFSPYQGDDERHVLRLPTRDFVQLAVLQEALARFSGDRYRP